MLSNKFNVDAPTYNELKRLSRVTADGYPLCWLSALREHLRQADQIARETYSHLDDLKELLARPPTLSAAARHEIASPLKRLIAFNNKAEKEKAAFDAVGFGECAEEADFQLKAVRRAMRLVGKSKKKVIQI
jgi:hypothetical protein